MKIKDIKLPGVKPGDPVPPAIARRLRESGCVQRHRLVLVQVRYMLHEVLTELLNQLEPTPSHRIMAVIDTLQDIIHLMPENVGYVEGVVSGIEGSSCASS